MAKGANTTVNTPVFIGNFPKLLEPGLNKLNNKMEYSVIACFPKGADLSKLQAAAHQAAVEKWGADPAKWPKNLRNPFRDGKEKEKDDEETGKKFIPAPYEEGAKWINLKSEKKPGVVNQNVQQIIEKSEIYSGVKLIACVRAYAYSQAGNSGISFGLQAIQKVADGESIGGQVRAEDAFAPIDMPTDGPVNNAGAAGFFS